MKRSKEWKAYSTKETYSMDELPFWFLEWHVENGYPFDLDGETVYPSQNLQLFVKYQDSLTCPECGLVPSFWALQSSGNRPYHLNLWGYDVQGNQRLFTKDHVVPRSKGGPDELSNYQPMCMRCNGRLGDKTKQKQSQA
jgi:hypothetical protein